MIVNILLAHNATPVLSYRIIDDHSKLTDKEINFINSLVIGSVLIVPFRSKNIIGIIDQINPIIDDKIQDKLKNIDINFNIEYGSLISGLVLSKNDLQLARFVSEYYMSSMSDILKLILPIRVSDYILKNQKQNQQDVKQIDISGGFNLHKLSDQQQEVYGNISNIIHNNSDDASLKPFMIKGVTGSGKTEVYFHLIKDVINSGKQVLIMLPEISLTSQLINRFRGQFNFMPVLWHSNIGVKAKREGFNQIITGNAKVIIGTRSSLFLPYKNLGMIIVDEEHDASYKQDTGVMYHARDVAVYKANLSRVPIILLSATPSIESLFNIHQNKYSLFKLDNQYSNIRPPIVEIIDMKDQKIGKSCWLSNDAIVKIKEYINNQKQVIIFLNRRGYAPLILCRKCGYREICDNCSSNMIVHKNKNIIQCHHCFISKPIIDKCSNCDSESDLVFLGPGIERIAEEVELLFDKGVNIVTLSKDTKQQEIDNILQDIENNKINIIIGTQIITKGYHFANLALAIVVDADLNITDAVDFRAYEKQYQLLYQLSGRVGREKGRGLILFQTYNPNDNLLKSMYNFKINNFLHREINNRKQSFLPPFSKVASINISSSSEDVAYKAALLIVSLMQKNSDIKVWGPIENMIFKLNNKYRFKILIISDKKNNIQKIINKSLESFVISSNITLKIDIDPFNFY